MSTSLSEAQLRAFIHEEVRKIFEAGLMYTAGCTEGKTVSSPSVISSPPSQKPSVTPPTAMPTLNMPEAIAHLTEQHFENGYYYINPKHFLPPVDFQIVNDWIKQQHGEYVKATSNIPGHWRVKN